MEKILPINSRPPYFIILKILSWVYYIAITIKLTGYRLKILKQYKLGRPVISVGNITLGGTGKTPAVISIAKQLLDSKKKVVILLRGYRSKYENSFAVVSDEKKVLLSPDEAGDEPYSIARKLPGVPVLIGKNRYYSGTYAIKEFSPDLILLDDGFTHLPLYRDINILLINSREPFGRDGLFPMGTLREPLESLQRADIFLLTRINQVKKEEIDAIITRLSSLNSGAKILQSSHKPIRIYNINDEMESYLPEVVKGKRVMIISGIADSYSFEQMIMRELNADELLPLRFGDHHHYTQKDIVLIMGCIEAYLPDFILTTEKDGVKLAGRLEHKGGIMAVEIELILPQQITVVS